MSDRPDQRASDRRYTFPASHRLKRRRLIRSLFDRSRDDVGTVAVGCVRLLFRIVDRKELGYDVPVQVGFAPGRQADSGVERTRVRRLLREVYRVHQHTLTDPFDGHPGALIVMILFRGDPARPETLWDDLPQALQNAIRRIESTDSPPTGASHHPANG